MDSARPPFDQDAHSSVSVSVSSTSPYTSNTRKCSLLTLPAELRNHIWSYLLIQDTGEIPTAIINNPCPRDTDHSALKPGSSTHLSPAILRVCRQTHAEGTPMLYGSNVYDAHTTLLRALPALAVRVFPIREFAPPVTSTIAASRIRRFRLLVRLDVDARFTADAATAAFTGVAELLLDVFQSSYAACDLGVLELFEGVREVECAVVRGSIGDGKYAAWLERAMMSERDAVWEKKMVDGGEVLVEGWPGMASIGQRDRVWNAWTHGNR